MKFYWNERYPETIYCLSPIYGIMCLQEVEDIDPETGDGEMTGHFVWTETVWTFRELKKNGFKLLGTI